MNITPTLSELAETIAAGLVADLKAKRLAACGIDEVRAAIAARGQAAALDRFDREHLETMTLRRLIAKAV